MEAIFVLRSCKNAKYNIAELRLHSIPQGDQSNVGDSNLEEEEGARIKEKQRCKQGSSDLTGWLTCTEKEKEATKLHEKNENKRMKE